MISNEYLDLLFGKPIRSLQTLLREISYYADIPRVIPDGKYDERTAETVGEFQKQNGLKSTMKTDFETWSKITDKFDSIMNKNVKRKEGERNIDDIMIKSGDKDVLLPVIQAQMKTLGLMFKNIPDVTVNGTHDENSVNCVKEIQKLARFETDGILDGKTISLIENIYKDFVGRSFSGGNPMDFIGKF